MEIKWQDRLDRYKIPIAISLVGIVLILGGFLGSNLNLNAASKEFPKESIVHSNQIQVDVSGAINKPGVYKLTSGSIVEDAIRLAGGISTSANNEYISKYLNMAQKISDGMKIYVPYSGDVGVVSSNQGLVAGVNSGPTNINMATQKELEDLPGIGAVTASKIIAGRPYQKIDDLLTQKIVSKSTFEKIKASINVF